MDKKLEDTVLNVTNALEKELDEQLDSFDNLQISDLEKIRAEKLSQMKKESEQKLKWRQLVS